MAELVADCPRCKVKSGTFELRGGNRLKTSFQGVFCYEIFSVCRHCHTGVLFTANVRSSDDMEVSRDLALHYLSSDMGMMNYTGAVNDFLQITGYVSLKDFAATHPPEHVHPEIEAIYREAAACQAIGCFNAAGAMYRLCLDLATKSQLPPEGKENGPNNHARRFLKARIDWLRDAGLLAPDVCEMSDCIREDGNEGAHEGTLTEIEVADLQDFCTTVLERLYTEPAKLALRRERRQARHRTQGR